MAPFLLLLLYTVSATLADYLGGFKDHRGGQDTNGPEGGIATELIIYAPSTDSGPVSIDPFQVWWYIFYDESYPNDEQYVDDERSNDYDYTIILVYIDDPFDPCEDMYEGLHLDPIFSTDVRGADEFLDVPASELVALTPGETLTVDLLFYSRDYYMDIKTCTSIRVSLFSPDSTPDPTPDPTPAPPIAIITPTGTIDGTTTSTKIPGDTGYLKMAFKDRSSDMDSHESVIARRTRLLLVVGLLGAGAIHWFGHRRG